MDLMEKYSSLAAEKSIRQFCPPRCFELSGQKFTFVIDTGENTGDYTVNFLSGTELEWTSRGSAPKKETYECRKADDYTYLLSYCLDGVEPRENHTWVIDLEQELVTFLYCITGENAYWSYMVDSHFGFGYVKMADHDHTDVRRHGFTNDVTGTCVRWTYGHNMSTIHVYHHPNWYRIGYPKNRVDTKDLPDATRKIRELMQQMPSNDEPAYYVKIKEGIYLVSVTEQNLEKILGEKFGFRSDTLCFLDNWNTLYSVGRAFGKITKDGADSDLFLMIGKYGSPVEVDDSFFNSPIPYLV